MTGELLSAVSIILVLLLLVFAKIDNLIEKIMNTNAPDKTRTDTFRKYNKDLKKNLYCKICPTMIIFGIIGYILLPKAWGIIISSTFSFWHFDALNTLFVCIEFGLLLIVFYLAIYIYKIYKKIT